MILKSNSRVTALIGGVCTLRRSLQNYEETQATIIFQDGIIREVLKLSADTNIDEHIKELKNRYDNLLAIRLDNPDNSDNPCHIFPRLIDIHNHIDYNMMPIWTRPVDQPWDNRHEWRNCTEYSDDIKKLFNFIFDNWSKYSGSGKNEDSYTVIQFFSELQAIAGGTTALQESTEISYYAYVNEKISRRSEHILLRSTGVSSDMGLSHEQEINSIIDFFKPNIQKIKEEEKAEGRREEDYFHPPIDTSTWEITEPVNQSTTMSYFQEYLELLKNNSVDEIRGKSGGYLVHLAEGRAGNLRAGAGLGYGIDSYSKKEFELLKTQLRSIPRQDMLTGISDVFETFSDFESVGTIIGGNLIFGTQELFDAFQLNSDRIVSLEADMWDENGKKITVDEGAKNLRVYIPDIEITINGTKSVVHIDFDDAINTLDTLFQEFNKEYGKNFIRGKLLSSYDLPYQKQIEQLKYKFGLLSQRDKVI